MARTRLFPVVGLQDDYLRRIPDDGCDVTGRPNQGRQHLLRMMEKTVKVPTGAVDPDSGKPLFDDVPLFRIVPSRGEPKPIPYDPNNRDDARLASVDRLSKSVPRDWYADDAWLAKQRIMLEVRARESSDAELRAAQQNFVDLAKTLTSAVQSSTRIAGAAAVGALDEPPAATRGKR